MNKNEKSESELKINKNAPKACGITHNNKECELFDNTCSLPQQELDKLLDELIKDKHFGINALSASDGIIYLDKPKLSHIQIKDDLYRLYLYRYHAIIENF